MSIERALIGTTDAAAAASVYVEEVFQSYLYTGNSSTQAINNGIDLASKGGLVWTKFRSGSFGTESHAFIDTVRGATKYLASDATNSEISNAGLTSFSTTGYALSSDASGKVNYNAQNYVSWTFRKQPKFFDVVTYTGTGSARTIAHSLNATPGMIIVKRTDTTGNWKVYHSGLTSAAYYCDMNTTAVQTSDTTVWNSTAPTSSVFSVGTHADVNASGGTYVAYIYAASSSGGFGSAGTDSVVACGSFVSAGTTTDVSVTLGWEPQFILVRSSSNANDWLLLDTMRGMSLTSQNYLRANTSAAETTQTDYSPVPTATGFIAQKGLGWTAGANIIYLAIRRPMKTPTDATKVFSPIAASGGSNYDITFANSLIPDFICAVKDRTGVGAGAYPTTINDRVRGFPRDITGATYANNPELVVSSTAAEVSGNSSYFSGVYNSRAVWGGGWTSYSGVFYGLKRAPGFFDVVCYTGTGALQNVSHNLGVAPELIIVKSRIGALGWITYAAPLGITKYLTLQTTDAAAAVSFWGSSSPTASTFPVDAYTAVNSSSSSYNKYVAYLFATCPGVSKVFSYTGNGSSQTINCGFTAGARFVLIKRTDSTGSWWVFDSARGIVSAADPALQLNSTAAEVTSADAIDPDSSGFIVNQETTCNLNVSSGTYVFLAIA